MQPLVTTTVTRPWHWGIVVVADAPLGGQIPDVDPGVAVSANDCGLVILVRHAQDVADFEGEFDFAEVSITVRLLAGPLKRDEARRFIFEGGVATPRGVLSIGDADAEVLVPAHEGSTNVSVSVSAQEEGLSPREVLLDLTPA